MGTNQTLDVQMCFKTILKALKGEDKHIIERVSVFEVIDKIPKLKDVEGIFNLDEKHIQYILYKALLRTGDYQVYMEDSYEEGEEKFCDITVYTNDWRESLWIEIKTTGWCTEGNYRRWVKADAEKLIALSRKGARKYLLVTSIEDGKQDGTEWNEWFEKEFQEVKFDPNLFGSFFPANSKTERKLLKVSMLCVSCRAKPNEQKREIEWLNQ